MTTDAQRLAKWQAYVDAARLFGPRPLVAVVLLGLL